MANSTDITSSSLGDDYAVRRASTPPAVAPPAADPPAATADDPGLPLGQNLVEQASVITPAVTPRTANTVGVSIVGEDDEYIALVQIGTPPREFKMIVDTGSADFWVGSETCTVPQPAGRAPLGCGNHPFLGPKSSTSFREVTGSRWTGSYTTGQMAGTLVTDNVKVGPLVLLNHPFGVAKTLTQEITELTCDGIMGLGQSSLARQRGQLSIVDSLVKQRVIAKPIVSIKMSRLLDRKNDGQVTFGGLDPTKFNPKTLVTVPNVSRLGLWEAPIDSVTANGRTITFAGGARTALMDTGSSINAIPRADATAIVTALGGQTDPTDGEFVLPCNTRAQLAFTIGKQAFTIDTRDLIVENPGAVACAMTLLPQTLSDSHGSPNGWVLGAPFLKNVYLSLDSQANTIGLAKLI
ncbi:acid protease [Dentipellis sp. KUC8613]|nr:acid protease [Dentipellis sp. KUC8613]